MAVQPPSPSELTPSHEFVAEDFHAATTALLEVALNHASMGFVGVRPSRLNTTVEDIIDPTVFWSDDHGSFEPVTAAFESSDVSWYQTQFPEADDDFRRLWALEAGRSVRFLQEFCVCNANDWIVYVIPHHEHLMVNAPDKEFASEVNNALTHLWACIVPAGTRITWEYDGCKHAIDGGTLQVKRSKMGYAGRYSLLNLFRVTPRPQSLTLSLEWHRETRSGLIGRFIDGIQSIVGGPPDRLRFEDETTMQEAETVLHETIETMHPKRTAAEIDERV
ncbi:hypothetical protein DMJ13_19780 [halophilic archaeon]|nr:hypothetical protein DMJ13_19780 [halophilic archaeon]